MRKLITIVAAAALLLVACGPADDTSGSGSGNAQACDPSSPPLFKDGQLTVGTDKPAYPPWFEGSSKNYAGFEGSLAAEIAKSMNVDIAWVVEPFNKSYAPGAKDYDFDINEISITPEREQAVDFSDGYFDDNQGFLVMNGSSIEGATSLADLKDAQLGTQVGTTSLKFINEAIQPTKDPKIFDTTNDVKSALESGQIDGLVTDVVTTVFLRDFEIKGSKVIGQFPTHEPFGMLFEEGNPLVDCVNQVLDGLKSDGTLASLQKKWLQQYLKVPTLSES
jgi:polar amino acid transport system substrate-binding protein